MPVVAAAVCPHPPLLIPELASGAAFELDPLRAACFAAVDRLADADALVIVGTGPLTGTRYDASALGSFGPYGAPEVTVGGPRSASGSSAGTPVLPLSLAVGTWLVEQSKAADLPRTSITVAAAEAPASCLALGQELAHGNERIALLVMGDGSARRSDHAPVHLHPRAEIFDSTVAAALELADAETLAALDPDLATELHAAGRAPWQVLAGAAPGLRGRLGYNAAPYGVGYFVASWAL
ncbi:class III extradiol dioxygenase subunit B-like domain-containing protein [Kribbella koreensis]|uniref:Class III extradiol dioxygenase subunit B-like domain-containing protein n=1 Tax=Kribbella koreensis TaxID=57909 RepID=A0ABN1PDQ0_9ACTN